MIVLRVRNVHEALASGVSLIREYGVPRDSRNGPVLEVLEPVTTVYSHPRERHLFHPGRKDNPFFHLLESLWMLSGSKDVEPLSRIVTRMRVYSDDSVSLHGAYGYRWRHHFGFDQLSSIVENLNADPTCRRQVLQMWSAPDDLKHEHTVFGSGVAIKEKRGSGADVPCNLIVTFKITVENTLRMTVFCRSNDAVWGAFGANAYHFSILHEYVAWAVGVEVGEMYQVSDSLHAYVEVLSRMPESWILASNQPDPYVTGEVSPPILRSIPLDSWHRDLEAFMSMWRRNDLEAMLGLRDRFFRRTAVPVLLAHRAYKDKSNPDRINTALELIAECESSDVKLACTRWLEEKR